MTLFTDLVTGSLSVALASRAWGTYTQRKDATSGVWQLSVEVLGGDATGLQITACGQEFIAETRDVS